MLRYRVYSKDILCDGMTESEAKEAILQLRDSTPNKSFELEEYNYSPEGKRLGRDPDLH
jgi:hypothetical protein